MTLLLSTCTLDASDEKEAQLALFLQQHSIDWNRLFALANRHRITPFLYRTLQKIPTAPEDFLKALYQSSRATATDNLLKLREYHVLRERLIENGIDHIVLKGIHLADQYYPDSSLRISGDIDILVRKEDVFKTIQVAQANQFHLNQQHSLHALHGEQTMLNELFEVSLFKPFFNNTYFDVDLHWDIMCFNRHYALFDLPFVRSQPALATELDIILIVTHHGVNNVWQHIYYINDLYFLLASKPINWPVLMNYLQQYGLERVFLAGVYWCRKIWNLSLPDSIEPLVSSKEISRLANAYARNWKTSESKEFSSLVLSQLTFFFRAQTGFRKQLKVGYTFFSSRLFRYSTFTIGKRRIYVPKELGFITIFIRAVQSLWRFLPDKR